jgi:hypothetical protein
VAGGVMIVEYYTNYIYQDMWTIQDEIQFFKSAQSISDIDRVMYLIDNDYYAFAPHRKRLQNSTIQSRNGLIGKYTEKWCKVLFSSIAKKLNLYPVTGVVCPEIGLTQRSSADLALCTKNSTTLVPSEIKIIFEIKMGIINNYHYSSFTKKIDYIGDYFSHSGNPSLLRSDSMLKAIGKSLNIRICESSKQIPIIILGNSPITESYTSKVDNLRTSGVIQHFLSLYPNPTNNAHIMRTKGDGFITIHSIDELEIIIYSILSKQLNYFSSMKSNSEIGTIISIASKQPTDELKGLEFLKLLQQ